jgi:choice-of-anchor A domain-containing protein
MNTDGSNDATTNKVVDYVCGLNPKGSNDEFSNCCVQTASFLVTSRWTLACVQKAADYAKNTLKAGDVCGRYAWAQGPIWYTKQYYPRDFNLFTLGDATGLGDVEGPVAAQGNVTATSFSLNGKHADLYALIAQGNINLNVGGTVYGRVSYDGSTFKDTPSVHYVAPSTRPTSPDKPIDFGAAAGPLRDMSDALNRYDVNGTTPQPTNHALTFTGTDPELNVFSFPSSYLTGTTVFNFNVPAGSAVIINVSGNAAFANAGYSQTGVANLHLQSVLWNFPSATKLQFSSTSIPGSILAPRADVTLTNGAISGTVVAKSAALSLQLDWNPYQVPSSTGCLSLDRSWSCSHDTALDDTGKAAAIKAEAGFFDIPLDNYKADGVNRTSPEHRIWYAFQPAQTIPKNQPLVVLFNGGPGSATSSLLFSFNTANMTLDPAAQSNGSTIASNPNNWAKLGNLLYIDAPATGFSYPLAYKKNDEGLPIEPDIGIDMSRDAGIFLQVITRFIVRHPDLLDEGFPNRIVLAAESYGGTRATLMLHYLYHYGDLADSNPDYWDPQVTADLSDYFSRVFGTSNPDTATQIARTFGGQVLIEPVIGGRPQVNYQTTDELAAPQSGCIPSKNPNAPCGSNSATISNTCDIDSCDKTPNWTDGQEETAAKNLNNVATLQTALGVDPTTIDWMHSSYRTLAYGRSDGFNTASMQAAFDSDGIPLGTTDSYFVIRNDSVSNGYAGAPDWESAGTRIGNYFLSNVATNVHAFITVAQYDLVVWSPAIAQALNDLADPNDTNNPWSSVLYTSTTKNGIVDRPGAMAITRKSPAPTLSVTMPGFYQSGHVVTMGGHDPSKGGHDVEMATALLADVMSWLDTF